MNNSLPFYQRDSFIYLIAGITSILLSMWVTLNQTINPDGICYIMSAQAYATHTIREAIYLCPQSRWPLYPMLLFGVQQLTHLSYETAAYFVNGLFSLCSVLIFIAIVKALGGTKRVLWLAAGVILLAHEFNTARQYIIRDHAFWAFYLGSIWLLLRYFRKPDWKLAFAWSVSTLIATLFRVEGVVFLIVMPFLAWFNFQYPFKQRVRAFFSLNLLLICICATSLIFMLLYPQQTLDNAGRLRDVLNQLQNGVTMIMNRYQQTTAIMANSVLPIESRREAGSALCMMLITWYIVSALCNMSYAYGLLIVYGWMQRAVKLTTTNATVLVGYLGVNFVITLGFLFEHLFLSRRYLIAMSLVLMLWVPFAMDNLINKVANKQYRLFSSAIAILLLISALGGIFEFGYSKAYMPQAGTWIAQNIPANASLYANDYQLMYYSQHFGEDIFKHLKSYIDINTIANGQWKQYDYLALRVGKEISPNMMAVLNEINSEPLQEFHNKRGDRVIIYKISH